MVGDFVAIGPAFRDRFDTAMQCYRVLFFSAPCGCGKTAVVRELLKRSKVDWRSASEGGALADPIKPGSEVLVLDDFQLLEDEEDKNALVDLIGRRDSLRFIILSRGIVPGWLMPFQLTGLMETFRLADLLLDMESSRCLLEAGGIRLCAADMASIQREVQGYPVALKFLRARLESGDPYCEATLDGVRRDLFRYFDEVVYRHFERPLRNLLLCLAPFDSFTVDMAKAMSGEDRAGKLVDRLVRDTTMLMLDGMETYRFQEVFRRFLLWKVDHEYSSSDECALYGRAGLYYEMEGDIANALECYTRSGDGRKVSELLERHAELHPGVGHYYETERFYRALPEREVMRSPVLISGMSMLCALMLDFDGSEMWYERLRGYAAGLKRGDADFREARARIAYLDIALPQRGSKGLIDLIGSLFTILTEKEIDLPAFSVTSTLPSIMNGGKDFCEWSKKDELIYTTMRRPVETVLGRDGVGLADCALCESLFEKGENISSRLLALLSQLGEVQAKGTPDIEFAIVGLVAREEVSQGRVDVARDTVLSLRERFERDGHDRFLANIDALLCRIDLRTREDDSVERWLREEAPTDILHLRAMWRYRYLTLAQVHIAHGEPDKALMSIAPLMPYCKRCARVMDSIHVSIITAICHYRMDDPVWVDEMHQVVDANRPYRFIWPIAQYGVAILPLLTGCEWKGDSAYLDDLVNATRRQAVLYPRFLEHAPKLVDPLSPAEMQVLRLLCNDMSNQQIGDLLGIKLATVKTHVSHILQKLGVNRRSEAKAKAEKLGLVQG